MSNTEPDAGGTQNFFRSLFQRNTTINAMAGSEIKIAGLEDATRQMSQLNSELKGLVTSLTGLSQQQATLTQGISSTMKTIASNAQQTASAVSGATESVSRFRSGAMSVASIFGSAVNSNFVKDLAMFPLRYITGATEQARNLGMGVSTALGGQMYATGATQSQLMQLMSMFPGGVQGGVEDIIGLQQIMRQSGAMADLNNAIGAGQPNPRAVGFMRGVAEMQAMTPGAPVAQMAQTLGGYAANVQAQQQSAYLTGGAFAMIGAGGRQKSVSEWAEGILRWLEGQRPGENRGRGFNYGELLAQYFPGSNIDAWLTQQGVPEGMKEYWWNYALAKSRMTGATTSDVLAGVTGPSGAPPPQFRVAPMTTGGNQALGRLQAASAQARGQFRLGGALTGMFANKETANRWFNEIIAQVMADVIPSQIAGGSLQAMGVLPDPIQELLMTFLERSGTLGAALGGYIGYGTQGLSGLNAGVFRNLFGGGLPQGAFDEGFLDAYSGNPNLAGLSDMRGALANQGINIPPFLGQLLDQGTQADVGDVGWTSRGSPSTAGLHPTVRGGIERMMGDNPRIRVTSGLRDTVQQRRLRAAGHSGVSGKPSAHTRGLAADLGPRSQYGWIAANAHRYGLKSGVSHGEPWHVGLPGIGDVEGTARRALPFLSFGDIGDDSDYFDRALQEAKAYLSRQGTFTFDDIETQLDAAQSSYGFSQGSQIRLRGLLVYWARQQSGFQAPPSTVTYDPATGTYSGSTSGAPSQPLYNPLAPQQGTIAATGTAGTTGTSIIGGGGPGIGGLFDMFKEGFTKDQAISTIGSLVPSLLNVFLGTFNIGGHRDLSSIAFDPNLYGALRKAAVNERGLISIGGTFQNFFPGGTVLPSGGGGGAQGFQTGGGAASGGSTPQNIYSYLRQLGVSEASAAGILANIRKESNFDASNATGDNGTSGGLFQHHAGRWTNLKNYAASTGRSWTDWTAQVDFALQEARAMGINLNQTNPALAAREWTLKFERPANAEQRARERAAIAGEYMFGDVPEGPDFSQDLLDYPVTPAVPMKQPQAIVFNNNFTINGGGQGGGIDVRRTVTMMAEQLEGEMKRRLSRSN